MSVSLVKYDPNEEIKSEALAKSGVSRAAAPFLLECQYLRQVYYACFKEEDVLEVWGAESTVL